MKFGNDTQDVCLAKGRGVLGCVTTSKKGLYSSQGTPEETERPAQSESECHGWYLSLQKRFKAGNSSIHLFVLLAATVVTPDPRIRQIADGFEAMMLNQLYGQMRKSNQIIGEGDDNPFAPSHAEMIYRSMQEDQMIQQMAPHRPLGLGNLVEKQLTGKSGIPESHLIKSNK